MNFFWRICLILGVVITLGLTACSPPNPNLTPFSPSDTAQIEGPSPEVVLNELRLMFSSNREEPGWYIMNPDGTDLQKLDFPSLTDYNLGGIKWIPELNAFAASLVEPTTQGEDLFMMDAGGNILQRLTNSFYGEGFPVYSPASNQFAFTCVESDLDICVITADGANQINLNLVPSRESDPQWTLSGERVVHVSNRSGVPGIWIVNKDGSNLKSLSEGPPRPESHPRISPDGQTILFQSQRDGNWEIYLMDLDGGNRKRLTEDPGPDIEPTWSPDGNFIAFKSNRSGGDDVFVMRADGTEIVNITNNPEIQIHEFIWASDSSQIYLTYAEEETHDIYVIDIDGSGKKNLTNHPAEDLDIQWVGQN